LIDREDGGEEILFADLTDLLFPLHPLLLNHLYLHQLFSTPLVQSIAVFPSSTFLLGTFAPPTFFQRLTGHSESLGMAQNGAG
jgi:hypothetical protein